MLFTGDTEVFGTENPVFFTRYGVHLKGAVSRNSAKLENYNELLHWLDVIQVTFCLLIYCAFP